MYNVPFNIYSTNLQSPYGAIGIYSTGMSGKSWWDVFKSPLKPGLSYLWDKEVFTNILGVQTLRSTIWAFSL